MMPVLSYLMSKETLLENQRKDSRPKHEFLNHLIRYKEGHHVHWLCARLYTGAEPGIAERCIEESRMRADLRRPSEWSNPGSLWIGRNYQPVRFYYHSFETILKYIHIQPSEVKQNRSWLCHLRKNIEKSPSFKQLLEDPFEVHLLERIDHRVMEAVGARRRRTPYMNIGLLVEPLRLRASMSI